MNDIVELPTDETLTLRLVPMPADTNQGGSVFGGWILSQIDIAASIPALKRAQVRVATVSVNKVEFHQPVFIGDVDVYAERRSTTPAVIKVTHAQPTFVALDENRRLRKVPEE